jgi:hypothetical protein
MTTDTNETVTMTKADAEELIAAVGEMHAHLRYNFLSVTREFNPRYTCRVCQCVFFGGAHPENDCVIARAEAILARLEGVDGD